MFDAALSVVLKFEGGYSNDPDDPGGATNMGVTQSTYDSFRKSWGLPTSPVKDISKDEVHAIYLSYYKECRADKFDTSYPYTSALHFDTAINMGAGTACRMLQKALNSFIHGDRYLSIDGMIGPLTLSELSKHTDSEILEAYLTQRKRAYLQLFDKNQKLEKWKASYWHRMDYFAAQAGIVWRAKDAPC